MFAVALRRRVHRYGAARASGRIDAGADEPTQSLLTRCAATDEGRWKEGKIEKMIQRGKKKS